MINPSIVHKQHAQLLKNQTAQMGLLRQVIDRSGSNLSQSMLNTTQSNQVKHNQTVI